MVHTPAWLFGNMEARKCLSKARHGGQPPLGAAKETWTAQVNRFPPGVPPRSRRRRPPFLEAAIVRGDHTFGNSHGVLREQGPHSPDDPSTSESNDETPRLDFDRRLMLKRQWTHGIVAISGYSMMA
jgi:hypothetical protein